MIDNLGTRISTLRKEKGFSQEQFAEKLGVSRQAVSKWESGKALPDIFNIVHMSVTFDVTTDYLLMGDERRTTIKDSPKPDKKFKTALYVIGSIIGAIILLCIPVMASIYQSIQFAVFHTAYTYASDYIFDWPLVGIVIVGAIMFIGNLSILIKTKLLKKEKTYE